VASRGGVPRKSDRRRDELARLKAEQQAQASRRKLTWSVGIGVVVLALIGGVTFALIGNNQGSTNSTPGAISGVQTFTGLGRTHVQGTVHYAQTPPVGGNHNPVWLNCGIYNAPVPNENAVHSLEHGAVWVTYDPTLPADEVAKLKQDVRGKPYTLLSPYPGLPSPVVASAWGLQLKLQNATDSRLTQFVAKYAQGPQAPEPGSPCTGGTGTPTG
jgi:hypothetical protein